jgi:hypothetical protein
MAVVVGVEEAGRSVTAIRLAAREADYRLSAGPVRPAAANTRRRAAVESRDLRTVNPGGNHVRRGELGLQPPG